MMDGPPFEPRRIPKDDQILFRMGEYFRGFGELEIILSMALSSLLKIDNALLQFLWREVFVAQKIKTLRRAAVEKLGSEHPRWLALKPYLNSLENDRLEFRNKIAHGAFISSGEGLKHGKPGQSASELFKGFDELDPEKILTESYLIHETKLRLVDFMVVEPPPK